MGIDTKALLTSAPDILEILHWANENYIDACLRASGISDFYWLEFKDGGDQRRLAVFPPDKCASDYADVCTSPAVYVSMGCWGNSKAIARRMAVKWGGMIMPNDSKDDWQNV